MSQNNLKEEESIAEKITELLNNNQTHDLSIFLNTQYPQDIAHVIEGAKEEEKSLLFENLNSENSSKVFAELSSNTQIFLLQTMGPEKFGPIVSQMDDDDATDFITQLPDEERTTLLNAIPDPAQQVRIQELFHYPVESAGRKMSTDFLKLKSDMTIENAFDYARKQAPQYKGNVYYLYVVDNNNKLVGVISLRNLISAQLNELVESHMSTDVISCKVTDDQEYVAQTISKYDLLAIPVTDEVNTLKGIITIDDVVDILSKETTEDIYQSSGISEESESDQLISGKVTYAVKARLPWLLITLIGEAFAALIISSFDKTIISAPIAVSFMPLLSGLSGNVGGQTATIIVRGLVTGDIQIKNTIKHVFHELQIGFVIGLICSIVTGLIAWQLHGMPILGFIVAFALCCSMISAVLLGTMFPLMLQHFKRDPASASSPVITTLLDILTFTFYLIIVSVMLNYLR